MVCLSVPMHNHLYSLTAHVWKFMVYSGPTDNPTERMIIREQHFHTIVMLTRILILSVRSYNITAIG